MTAPWRDSVPSPFPLFSSFPFLFLASRQRRPDGMTRVLPSRRPSLVFHWRSGNLPRQQFARVCFPSFSLSLVGFRHLLTETLEENGRLLQSPFWHEARLSVWRLRVTNRVSLCTCRCSPLRLSSLLPSSFGLAAPSARGTRNGRHLFFGSFSSGVLPA